MQIQKVQMELLASFKGKIHCMVPPAEISYKKESGSKYLFIGKR